MGPGDGVGDTCLLAILREKCLSTDIDRIFKQGLFLAYLAKLFPTGLDCFSLLKTVPAKSMRSLIASCLKHALHFVALLVPRH